MPCSGSDEEGEHSWAPEAGLLTQQAKKGLRRGEGRGVKEGGFTCRLLCPSKCLFGDIELARDCSGEREEG